jgi:inner membrane protein
MDSLTQIVLGAAVGEVCLGKRLGNRAMFWGAVAGTIPDLDVLSSPFLSPLQSLIFHRGISHSILFALLFPLLIAWLVNAYYDKGYYKNKLIRLLGTLICSLIFGGFVLGLLYGMVVLDLGIYYKLLLLMGAAFFAWIVWRSWKYYGLSQAREVEKIAYTNWYWFFFWTIFTHPILDCFTAYGTQLFAPFSSSRVSWDNISVVDPLYTMPFLICLVIASFYKRYEYQRSVFNFLGICLSSLYMIFTLWNKDRINTILENTLAQEQIKYSRYMTAPTILNNVLWSATVESDSLFYQGSYSIFDNVDRFKLKKIVKNHTLLGKKLDNDYTIQKLRWFSKDYFALLKSSDGYVQLNDLRFGIITESQEIKETDYVFRFKLIPDKNGSYHIDGSSGRPQRGEASEILTALWARIKGI